MPNLAKKILWKNGKGIMPLTVSIDKPERRRNSASFEEVV
jgi:hypothetical protein